MRLIWLGPIRISAFWCSENASWAIHKAHYGRNKSSWRHGTAWLGKLKLMW